MALPNVAHGVSDGPYTALSPVTFTRLNRSDAVSVACDQV